MLCNIIPITLITASFKFVGQKTIADDRFLSNVATASSLFNSGGRILWGAICDRFSFKIPLSIMLSVWAILLFSFPYVGAIPTVGKALYALWVCTLFLSLSGVFVLMPAATGRIFGPVYMAVNYGMVFSAFVSDLPFCPSPHPTPHVFIRLLCCWCMQAYIQTPIMVVEASGNSSTLELSDPTLCPPQAERPSAVVDWSSIGFIVSQPCIASTEASEFSHVSLELPLADNLR
ncbi:unnamed protein product [Schistocephalus solidus]|uniref:Nodulin-like domain-containing protein n=1 Tax=Schistocephalus solidus TaxID=70667 RepID=A0A183T7V3_SCHSO|nr:unnamed protein product [Schistocephalus solidus]